jgi:caffeoyl-CoA O-methyltransferase
MEIVQHDIMDYVMHHCSEENDVLKQVNNQINERSFLKKMISGHYQGLLFSMLSKWKQPNRILEIGTFTGYSAIALATGLTEEGRLTTIEFNEELENDIRANFKLSGLESKIDLLIGDAHQLIPSLQDQYDLIFIDADKKGYLDYYHLLKPKLTSGGLIMVDNVLWNGYVADKNNEDAETLHMRAFNEAVSNDPDVTKLILPVRDGLFLIMKN